MIKYFEKQLKNFPDDTALREVLREHLRSGDTKALSQLLDLFREVEEELSMRKDLIHGVWDRILGEGNCNISRQERLDRYLQEKEKWWPSEK